MAVLFEEVNEFPSNEKFALVSNVEDSDFFVGLMNKYTDYYVIPKKEDSLFVSRVAWFAKRNHMALRFSNGLARLEQSVIYNRWDHHYQLYEVIVMTKSKLDSQNSKVTPWVWAY